MSDEKFQEIDIEGWDGSIYKYNIDKSIDCQKKVLFECGFTYGYNLVQDRFAMYDIEIYYRGSESLIDYTDHNGGVCMFICKNQREKLECLAEITNLCKKTVELNMLLEKLHEL